MSEVLALGRFHVPQGSEAHTPQPLKPLCSRAHALQPRETDTVRSLRTAAREEPSLATTRESLCASADSQRSKK